MALASIIKAHCSDKGYHHSWSECKKKYLVEDPSTASSDVALSSDVVFNLLDVEGDEVTSGSIRDEACVGGSDLAMNPDIGMTTNASLIPSSSTNLNSSITIEEDENNPDIAAEDS